MRPGPGGTDRGNWGTVVGDSRDSRDSGNGRAEGVRRERAGAERLTEGLTVAVASALSLVLLAALAVVFGTTSLHLVTDPGTTVFSRIAVPVVLLALVALPPALACLVLRSGRRRGRERLTVAVPAALTLLGATTVPFAALVLILVHAD
ncbi:hypothetical protein ACFVHR_36500 [Streptomyces sp. NPDC127168]|uniref:hypothetical protein n=1 Tax=unclassified Streptomyces TaxID=2593676 RepID=UPI003639A606